MKKKGGRKLMKVILVLLGLAIFVGGCGTNMENSTSGGKENLPVNVVEIQIEQVPEETKVILDQLKGKENTTIVQGDEYLYALITMGEMPTGGYKVKLDSIQETGDELIISYEYSQPNPSDAVLQVITFPYLLLEVMNTDKEIVFKKIEQELVSSN
jgi:hypothetical protein